MTPSTGLLEDLAQEQAAQQTLRTGTGFREAAERVASLVADLGAGCLVGASQAGNVLAGAVSSATGVPVLSAPACVVGPVVVIETVLVTGVGIARVLESLPEQVSPVIVIAADAPAVLPEWIERSADKVLVLRPRDASAV